MAILITVALLIWFIFWILFISIVERDGNEKQNDSQDQEESKDADVKITRLEVIDHREWVEKPRAYVATDAKIELSYQDWWRTLKIFVTE